MSEHTCPVCGHTQGIFALCKVKEFSIYGCTACGAEHVFPMPNSEFLKAYYDREEWFEGGEAGGYENYDQQTAWSVEAIKPTLDAFGGMQGLSVLDVGCGYGAHLELAATHGWKCFGVEVSDHARQVAQKRLDGKAYIVETVEGLIPHEFDLILMLDVIEHLPSPYTLFYRLFSIGAITPKTRIVISTPNAGADDARQDPAGWPYRHPPSHLVYYTAESLEYLLKKLHFTHLETRGLHPLQTGSHKNSSISGYGGLVVTATGSDFTEFMRERYVPGTWSKIAEYEHLPRYALAKTMVVGKKVLDFGCGTGYGAAALAEVATHVTGLDIDQAAISWATATHNNPNLTFHRCGNLGATLPAHSFDAVICFEMIEHVDYETQMAVIANIARLLRDDGVLIISTPNPEITKLYGANPYHLREMSLSEFNDLLGQHFPHIRILEQRVRNSIAFNDPLPSKTHSLHSLSQDSSNTTPLAYVAICSKEQINTLDALVVFDDEVDLIQDYLAHEKKLNEERFGAYRQAEEILRLNELVSGFRETFVIQKDIIQKHASEAVRLGKIIEAKDVAIASQAQEIVRLNDVVLAKDAAVASQAQEIVRLNEVVLAKDAAVASQAEEIDSLVQAVETRNVVIKHLEGELAKITQWKWYRLGMAIKSRPVSAQSLRTIVYLLASLILPYGLRRRLYPVAFWRQRKVDEQAIQLPSQSSEDNKSYVVRHPLQVIENPPRVVHVIANFCTGGSSRLVVDLIEHLGRYYEQSVVTSHIPITPAYVGIDITEYRSPANEQPFVEYFSRLKPALIHVHYWGDCDESWYSKAIKAAEQLGIPIIENINTPIAPYVSSAVKYYVHVSNYVRREFGKDDPTHVTIYPGSDFAHFYRGKNDPQAENCVGMVYRLERDKLNEASILPFIRAVQKRPDTRVLIVGGGSLLEEYKRAVTEAGLVYAFEFTDYVSYTKLPEYYRRMAVFVAPVWKESFGQVSPFAMNMEIPVCGYDVGAIGEIVVNPDLLAPPADAERLAEIIVRLLDSPNERKAIGENQHHRAQAHFSVQAMIHSYGEIYQQMTGVPTK